MMNAISTKLKMKKLVIIHPSHWEQALGGAELQISYLVKHAAAKGYHVHIIFEEKGVPITHKEKVSLHPLKKKKLRKSFGHRWFLYVNQIYKKLCQIQPDVIYTRIYSSWSGVAAKYANEHDITHIWALASDRDVQPSPLHTYIRRPLNIIEYYFISKAFAQASKIIAQNTFQKKELAIRYHRSSTLIYQMTPGVPEEILVKTPRPIQILWIGNLKPLKQPQIFTQLASRFKGDTRVSFKMIGKVSPKYEKTVSNTSRVSGNFTYLGQMTNDQVNDILFHSHILINTSEYEGFSNTFVQAWMRKVVVISMHSNPDDILTEKKIGFVCPSVASLENEIKNILNRPEQLKRMGEKAYQHAMGQHALEKNIIKVFNLIEGR